MSKDARVTDQNNQPSRRNNPSMTGVVKETTGHAPSLRLRVLAVDDEPDILEIYTEALGQVGWVDNTETSLQKLQSKLFGNGPLANPLVNLEVDQCLQGDQAVEMVRQALADQAPYAVIFLDMRMPPGPDGVWTAQQVRNLDPNVEILIVTAHADVHPLEIASLVPPPGKLFYVRKPFHAQEIQQFCYALCAKWRAEKLLDEANRELEKKVKERTAELEQANRRLERLAITDELTGLFNRRHLVHKLDMESARAWRYHNHLALLMLDLDRFKEINDRYGHACGDYILKEVAQILDDNTRSSDIVARFGGEEFTIILLETDGDRAYKVAENLRRIIYEKKFEYEGQPIHLSVSIGLATYPDVALSPDELLRKSDQAMYQAKEAGRNKVLAWTPDQTA